MKTKHIILIVFLFVVNGTYAQCWQEGEVPFNYKINTVYTLDSLIVSKKVYGILDHSISLIDSFDVNRQETWLYYVICFNSRYDQDDGTQVRIELKQGVDYNILMFYLFEDGDRFSGAFCYKGYTFFVLCENDHVAIYSELFKTNNKSDFHVYYKSPAICKKWIDLDYPYMEKYIFLFHQYKDSGFFYSGTSFIE